MHAPAHESANGAPLRFSAASEGGPDRSENQDAWGAFRFDRGALFLVCDGVGGGPAGQLASQTVIGCFREKVRDLNGELEVDSWLRESVDEARRRLAELEQQDTDRRGMATTLTLLLLMRTPGQGWRGWTLNVGDSRIYRCRDGRLTQLTDDHTWAEELVRSGEISAEESEGHRFGHMLTRAVVAEGSGAGSVPSTPDIEAVEPQAGDRFLLCSDGLSGALEASRLEQQLQEREIEGRSEHLLALAFEAGPSGANPMASRDNATAIVVDLTAE